MEEKQEREEGSRDVVQLRGGWVGGESIRDGKKAGKRGRGEQ